MAKTETDGAITYFDGAWVEGSPFVARADSHALWMASTVFDGARAFDGVAPDLDRHCARVIESAMAMGLRPTQTAAEIEALAWEGIRRFPPATGLYICPMFFAESGFIVPDPDSTRFALAIYASPLPAGEGFSACLSSFRRPAPDMALTNAKAACLYPNVARALREAREKGFDSAVVLDPERNVAEFAFMNLFAVKGGVVSTPAANGTFLNGITRRRVVGLLRDAGIPVAERSIAFAELLEADELFCTGNYAKVAPCRRLEDRDYPAGPVFESARSLYFDFARGG